MIDLVVEFFEDLWRMFLGSHLRHSPLYIAFMVIIGLVLYWRRGLTGGFLKWLFPKSMYYNNSTWLDIKIFAVSRALGVLGFFGMVAFGSQIASSLSSALNNGVEPSGYWNPFLITLCLILVSDFSTYWVHRVHHEFHWLWPFHSVHHSAETMTPITVYRKHPIYDLLGRFVHSGLNGVLQGLLLGLFIGEMSFIKLAGINGAYFLFNILGANFRHSHVWISYGPKLEHVFISPAQHQIHHSIEMRHRNKNYGEVFAFWDWMFGTLYVPRTEEKIQFGISDDHGNPIPQPHNTLTQALVDPVKESWAALKGELPEPTSPEPVKR